MSAPVVTVDSPSAQSAYDSDSETVASSVSSGSSRYVPPALRKRAKIAEQHALIAEYQAKAAAMGLDLAESNKRAAKHQGETMPTFKLPFFLDKARMDFLTNRFPRTTFRCVSDNNHDHPLAHTETMIATQKAMRMIPGGSTVVDVFGSVSAMRDFNRSQSRSDQAKRGFAYIGLKTAKDYIRHRNKGQAVVDDVTQYVMVEEGPASDLNLTKEGIDVPGFKTEGGKLTWFAKHTLYYLDDEDIFSYLKCEGSTMLAVVHRHPAESADLYNGECSYAKKHGMIEQVNKKTGERYTHRDLSWLWDSTTKTKITNEGAFTWTFHMISEDTWIIELMAVPQDIDERFTSRSKSIGPRSAAHELNKHSLVPTPFEHPALAYLPKATCTLFGGIPIIKFEDIELPDCRITNNDLYDFLRTTIVGKPRDAQRLQDLFALARTQVAQASQFPGKQNFECKPEDLAGHVILAFVSNLSKEVSLLRAVEAYHDARHEHSQLLDGVSYQSSGGMRNNTSMMLMAAKKISAARKNASTFDAILSVVEHA